MPVLLLRGLRAVTPRLSRSGDRPAEEEHRMAVYIEWAEETTEFDHWHYAGGGVTEVVLRPTVVKKRALYSHDNSAEMVARAQRYVNTDRPDARVVVIDDGDAA